MTFPTLVGSKVQAPRARSLAAAGIIGPIVFTTLVVVQGFLIPDYSHVSLPISALAAWPTGWIQAINFYVTGVLTIVFAAALHGGVVTTPHGGAGAVFLGLGGVGIILAGIFPWKMIDGIPTETPSHVVGSIMAFACTGIGVVVLSRGMKADPHWRDLAAYTMWSGIAVLVLFVTVGVFGIADGTPLHPWVGLLQRVICAVWFIWLIAAAIRLRGVASKV